MGQLASNQMHCGALLVVSRYFIVWGFFTTAYLWQIINLNLFCYIIHILISINIGPRIDAYRTIEFHLQTTLSPALLAGIAKLSAMRSTRVKYDALLAAVIPIRIQIS